MDSLKNNLKPLQIMNIAALIVVIAINILSNALPINGITAGEISDALPSFFTPAGYTFSIWGLIYIALIGFGIYQALPAQRQRPYLRQIGPFFAISTLFNSAWLLSWHYGQYALSVIFMVGLLITLITIYQRLNIGQRNPALTIADKLFYQLPFSLYLGWITVATIANIASVTAYFGFDGLGIAGPTWSAIMMLVATAVAGILLTTRRSLAYAGVLVWALFGIRAAYPEITLITNTALISASLITIFAVIGYWRSRQPMIKTIPQTQAG